MEGIICITSNGKDIIGRVVEPTDDTEKAIVLRWACMIVPSSGGRATSIPYDLFGEAETFEIYTIDALWQPGPTAVKVFEDYEKTRRSQKTGIILPNASNLKL